MLIHARHAHIGELHSECLRFQFEEAPFRLRVGALTRRFSKNRDAPENDPNLLRLTRGTQGIAQLSPECGNRFSFWLPSPASALTVIIGRMNSLARSQRMTLQIGGADRRLPVHIDHSFITLGSFRLLFIPPEELISRSIREDLNRLTAESGIHALIIDQIHRMVEQRPDFDPSYLRIPVIIKDLTRSAPVLTVLALTHDRGRETCEAVQEHLGLERLSVPCRQNFYQPGIRHHMIATYAPKEKLDRYHEMAFEILPGQLVEDGASSVSLRSLPPYSDPYQAALDAKDGIAAIPAAHHHSIETFLHSNRTAPEKTGVLVQTSLADSVETWLYRTVEAAETTGRLHCIRIADLPNEVCEADMHRRGKRMPQCQAFNCPFDRDELCDYGKQHHFIQKMLPDPRKTVVRSVKVLSALIAAFQQKEAPAIIPVHPDEAPYFNLALHRLLKLRLFDIYFMDRTRNPWEFKIYGFSPDFHEEAAQVELLMFFQRCDTTFLKQYRRMPIETFCSETGDIARWKDHSGDRIRGWIQETSADGALPHYAEHPSFFETVGLYIFMMVAHVRESMADRAYNRAWNLKALFKNRRCRYRSLLKAVRLTAEEWQCGRCDVCHLPAREGNFPFIRSDLMEELDTRLCQWLENDEVGFDALSADQIVEHAAGYIENIKKRADRLLENSPQNIKALYLAHELSPEDEKRMYAFDLMQSAGRSLPLLSILRLYDTLRAPDDLKRLFFDLFDDEFSCFNTPEGERWLFRKARRLGLDGVRTTLLKERVLLNNLLETDFRPARERLHQLTKEI